MKKTTYIMIGAIVGGFIAVLSLSRWYMHNTETMPYDTAEADYAIPSIGGEVTKTPLPPFDAMVIGDNGDKVKIANYKGMAVCESDTATRPWLMTRAQWQPLLLSSVADGTLDLRVNREAIADLYGLRVSTEDYMLATVIVPRGMVNRVSVTGHTLYLDSVRAKTFAVSAPDRLVLNVCTIGSLRNSAGTMDELKLDASTVDMANLRGVSGKFTVTCTTPESVIDTLAIDGVSKGNKARLRLKRANIGTLVWNPDDNVTDIDLETSNPINFVRQK